MHPAVALLSPTAAKMMIIAGVPGCPGVGVGNFVPTAAVALYCLGMVSSVCVRIETSRETLEAALN